MLNLGMLTLSASSLERRIVVMRSVRGRSALRSALAAVGALSFLVIACATRIAPAGDVTAAARRAPGGDPDVAYMRQIALEQVGGRLQNGHQYWALFNADWSLNRFDSSTVGTVLMSEGDAAVLRMANDPWARKPYYDMQESLFSKFPALAGYREPGYPIYGAFGMISGSDSAVVNWGHLGP